MSGSSGQFAEFIQNRLYRGDCLEVMRRLRLEGVKPDLIYLDPPFNSNRNYNIIFRAEGQHAQQVAFSDMWEKAYREETRREIADIAADIDTTDSRLIKLLEAQSEILGNGRASEKGLFNYLLYMAHRLLWCQRILSPRGSIYLHCDPTASHYLKIMMDLIFGNANFLNEIIWCYRKWTNAANSFQKNHHVLLAYTKSGEGHVFNKLFDGKTAARAHYVRGYTTNRIKGVTQLLVYDKEKAARKIEEGKYDRVVYRVGRTLTALPDWWEVPIINSQAKERLGYPTQKPQALLERIISASSNKGDLVLDPFCGCGTTVHAAHKLGRKWIGVDISLDACLQIKNRLHKHLSQEEKRHYEYVSGLAETPAEYANLSPFEKQKTLVQRLGGICGPKGGDGGVDGVIRIHLGGEDAANFGDFIISVKSGGQANPAMLDQLLGTMQKRGAKMGGLILDREPTLGMTEIIRKSKKFKYELKILGEMQTTEYPSVQILTSEQVLGGEEFARPPTLMEKKLRANNRRQK